MREPGELTLPDTRILELMRYAVKNDIARNEGDFWAKIRFQRTALPQIIRGQQSFRVEHIINACLLTGASADWVLGIESEMFRNDPAKPTAQVLKEIVAEMEGKRGRVIKQPRLF